MIIIFLHFNLFFIRLAVKDLMPGILQHLGPKQFGDLKELLAQMGGDKAGKPEDEDIPQLESNFEETSK